MRKLTFYSHSSRETMDVAGCVASFLKPGQVVGLYGNLGSGKTTFIKGLAKGLGFKGRVNSPSYVILKVYSIPQKSLLYHFDLYRLNSLKELEDIGYEDFISDSGICMIEWADKAKKLLPENFLKVRLEVKGKNIRLISLTGYGPEYESLIARTKSHKKEKRIWNQ